MYIAGELRQLEPVLFEALCLFEGLERLGFGDGRGEIKAFVGKVNPGHAKRALLSERTNDGDMCLWVRVRAPRVLTIGLAFGELPPEEGVDFAEEVEWRGCVGPAPWSDEEFQAKWSRAVSTFRGAVQSEIEPLWEASRVRKVLPRLEQVLRGKGFEVRA